MSKSILEIDLDAIRYNYKALQTFCPKAKVGAAVKANCYGLGVKAIAPVLYDAGCRDFFVANFDEGIELRKILVSNPKDYTIYVFNGMLSGEARYFYDFDLVPVLNSMYQINVWNEYAKNKYKKLPCVIHIDTGMNRLGMMQNELGKFEKNQHASFLDILYVMSHLASAEEYNNPINERQRKRFEASAQKFPGIKQSLANSNGIFLGKNYQYDLVRPGAALYGMNPDKYANKPVIKIPIKLLSPILQIKDVPPGDAIGYNATYVNNSGSDIKIATIALGYGDGIHRVLSNKGVCYINGFEAPLVGRVSMDLITLDVSKVPEEFLQIGSHVEVIGKNNSPLDIAETASTNYYEIITALGNRFERVYNNL